MERVMNEMNSKLYNLFRIGEVLKLLIFINYSYYLYLQNDPSSFRIMIQFVVTDTCEQTAKRNVRLL